MRQHVLDQICRNSRATFSTDFRGVPSVTRIPLQAPRRRKAISDGAISDAMREPSALASLPREQRQELSDACVNYDICDPVFACRITALWDACVQACRKSGKRPPELMRPSEDSAGG